MKTVYLVYGRGHVLGVPGVDQQCAAAQGRCRLQGRIVSWRSNQCAAKPPPPAREERGAYASELAENEHAVSFLLADDILESLSGKKMIGP